VSITPTINIKPSSWQYIVIAVTPCLSSREPGALCLAGKCNIPLFALTLHNLWELGNTQMQQWNISPIDIGCWQRILCITLLLQLIGQTLTETYSVAAIWVKTPTQSMLTNCPTKATRNWMRFWILQSWSAIFQLLLCTWNVLAWFMPGSGVLTIGLPDHQFGTRPLLHKKDFMEVTNFYPTIFRSLTHHDP